METIIPTCQIKGVNDISYFIVYCQKQTLFIAAQAVTKFGVLRSTQLLYQGLTAIQITIFLYIWMNIILKTTGVCRNNAKIS